MNPHRRNLLAGMAAAPLLSLPAIGRAQGKYPSGPVTLIVPFPPGGGTDASSRTIAQAITQLTGWNIVVENRPGAGGNIGLGLLSHANADGMTIGMGQTSNLAINPSLYKSMPYDARKDFAPIALVSGQPMILVVREGSPLSTLKSLVDAAKANPGKLNMASAGIGTVGHLAGEMFAIQAGIKIFHVPYPGAARALADLAGGQVDLYFGTPASVLPLMQSGKLHAVAVTSLKRLPVAKDVPTIAEQGYPDFEAEDWKALVAPRGTPASIVENLNRATNEALKQPLTQQRFAAEGSVTLGGSVADASKFMASEYERWGKAVRDSGTKME
ncbi:LacI family transcriptional regulator [Bordetella genomosp. 8]|uniref:LacI family transcriptional regulator n=1 Tax=Bordetella genomosp. 8 TaxID=1416806 RepID=A0A1W6YRG8_9BORD|nr:tripartite tricarboxylate transporter substrate binding protein [Bordetella genomosp. 8]ARP83601.1 LacI family transcriptional regulator [Bordetella genomosp. 8]